MIDLEPILEAPLEEASNLFRGTVIGIGLLAAVAILGRSTVAMAVVAVCSFLLPGYIVYRAWVWDRDETATDDDTEDNNDGRETISADDDTGG